MCLFINLFITAYWVCVMFSINIKTIVVFHHYKTTLKCQREKQVFIKRLLYNSCDGKVVWFLAESRPGAGGSLPFQVATCGHWNTCAECYLIWHLCKTCSGNVSIELSRPFTNQQHCAKRFLWKCFRSVWWCKDLDPNKHSHPIWQRNEIGRCCLILLFFF